MTEYFTAFIVMWQEEKRVNYTAYKIKRELCGSRAKVIVLGMIKLTFPKGNFFKNVALLLLSPKTKSSATLIWVPENWAVIKAL